MVEKARSDLCKTTDADFDVSAPWDGDNQAWWDWYVGLAEDTGQLDQTALKTDVALDPDPAIVRPLSLDALEQELAAPYDLSIDAVAAFRANGYVKLPGVISPAAVVTLRAEIAAVLGETFGVALDSKCTSPARQANAPGSRFYSGEMAWLDNRVIRLFVLSPRIAKICTDLLEVDAVRLYHDNLLAKEPGCGRTPWHYDDHHFPLATNEVVTAWIAAQAIPKAMGPLAFAKGMDVWKLVADVPFSKADTSYDRRVAEIFAAQAVMVDDGPFAVGEVSFHHNLNFHTAGSNSTPISRCALANTFFVDGARVVDAPTMVSGDWNKFLPGIGPGDVAASHLNPVCWPAKADWSQAPESETRI